jgi:riboflavin-specific deaminase-like protein
LLNVKSLFPASRAVTVEEVVEGLRLWEHESAVESAGPRSGQRREGHKGGQPQGEWRGGWRPRIIVNMACTADGRATVGGRSGPIGNRADREFFHGLRTAVDAVLVGAGTVRAERYHALVREESHRRLRRARGLAEEPLACIVSASLALPADLPLLADPAARVAILTSSTADLPPSAANVEYVRTPAPHDDKVQTAVRRPLDLPAALAELRERLGVRTILCEGGPHLNAQLFAAGLVDELFLSFAPKLAGGDGGGPSRSGGEFLRIVSGPELDPPVELELVTALESESQLLLRYRVLGASGAPGSGTRGSTAGP